MYYYIFFHHKDIVLKKVNLLCFDTYLCGYLGWCWSWCRSSSCRWRCRWRRTCVRRAAWHTAGTEECCRSHRGYAPCNTANREELWNLFVCVGLLLFYTHRNHNESILTKPQIVSRTSWNIIGSGAFSQGNAGRFGHSDTRTIYHIWQIWGSNLSSPLSGHVTLN